QVAESVESSVLQQATFVVLCRAGADNSSARRTGHARDTSQRSFPNGDCESRYKYRTPFIQWFREGNRNMTRQELRIFSTWGPFSDFHSSNLASCSFFCFSDSSGCV
ncbi:MAG TPA: hypothetical protein DDZ90_17695, partial [Planctomycetaceae bacterium]|nr:hypothetical protein [Planctomycetaceae bacterium]